MPDPEPVIPTTPPTTPPTVPETPPVTPPVTPPAEPPKEGEAPKEPAKPEEPPVSLTPEALRMPEGFEADKPVLDKFVGVMNDPKLTPNARAQALVDLQAEVMKGASERASQLWADKQTEWQNEVKADTEVGGAKLEGVLAGISTLLNTHGSPEVRQAFDETGAGNNLHIVKFLNKVAGMIGEGKPAPAVIPATPPATLADRMFPNHK